MLKWWELRGTENCEDGQNLCRYRGGSPCLDPQQAPVQPSGFGGCSTQCRVLFICREFYNVELHASVRMSFRPKLNICL